MTLFSHLFGKGKKKIVSPLPDNTILTPQPNPHVPQAADPSPHDVPSPNLPSSLPLFSKGDLILGNYEVEDIIRTGGMGRIYVTNHKGWKVSVAIKSPTEEMLSHPSYFQRVTKEAEAWTDLGLHPNIAYCYFVRNIEEVPHIFIEYVDGGNLHDWIKDRKASDLKTGLDLAIQFCHGMAHAHSKGMIHRDIKPANILMTKDGILKVTDFGIARMGGAEEEGPSLSPKDLSKTVGFIGTESYASPEQLRDAHSIGPESDIYSFGVCLWEMFLGRRPYPNAYAKLPTPDPKMLNPDLPESLCSLLTALVSFDLSPRKSLGGFASLRDRFKELYKNLFSEDAPHSMLETLNLAADGLNNRAVSYLELGKEEEAEKCWEEALKADPQHLESTFNGGHCRWNNGALYHEVLRTQMSSLESIHEGRPEFWRLLAWLHYEQGDIDALGEIENSGHGVADPEFLKLVADLNGLTGWWVRTLKGHDRFVSSVAFSPDGKYALSGSWDGTLRLWDVGTVKEIRCFEGHIGLVFSVAFSPDGSYVLSGGSDSTLRLWEARTCKEIRRFEGHSGHVSSVAFSPDGKYALSGSWDNTLRLWEASTGKEIRCFEGHSGQVSSVAFSPDGRYVLSGSDDNTLRLWQAATGKEIRCFEGHSGQVSSVAFSPDGRYVLSGSNDTTLRLWEASTGKEIRRFEAHNGIVGSVAFSPDGTYVLSGSWDCTLRLWDAASGKVLRRLAGHSLGVFSVAFSPDGRYILSGSLDKTFRLWETETGKEIRRFEGHGGGIDSVAFSPDGRYILSGSNDTTLRFWELDWEWEFPDREAGQDVRAMDNGLNSGLEAHLDLQEFMHDQTTQREPARVGRNEPCPCGSGKKYKKCCGLSERPVPPIIKEALKDQPQQNGKDESRAALSDVQLPIDPLPQREFQGQAAAFSTYGRYLVCAREAVILVYEVETGREVRSIEGHVDVVKSVSFSPDGGMVLSGGGDGLLHLWEVKTGQEIRKFEGHGDSVEKACFSPDGRSVLSGSWDETVRLWDAATGLEIRRFEGHANRITSVCFSLDGRHVLSASRDRTIRLWETEGGREVMAYKGHTAWVNSACFLPGGRILSGGGDKTIRLWEAKTGNETGRLGANDTAVLSVDCSSDGQYAVSGNGDNFAHLWDVETGREIGRFGPLSNWVAFVSFSRDGRWLVAVSDDNKIGIWPVSGRIAGK